MIKFKFKFDKETISATVPGSWDEVTTEQFIKMDYANWDGLDIVEIIAIISGVDLHKLYVTKSKPLEAVYTALAFLQQSPPKWEELKIQKYITIWNKQVKIPEDLELEAFGLWLEFQQLSESKDVAKVCALYLQPALCGGKIDRGARKDVEKSILKLPIMVTIPIINFFLLKVNEYLIYGKPVLNLLPLLESSKKAKG